MDFFSSFRIINTYSNFSSHFPSAACDDFQQGLPKEGLGGRVADRVEKAVGVPHKGDEGHEILVDLPLEEDVTIERGDDKEDGVGNPGDEEGEDDEGEGAGRLPTRRRRFLVRWGRRVCLPTNGKRKENIGPSETVASYKIILPRLYTVC